MYITESDVISLGEARCLLVSVAERFLNEINIDPEVKSRLDEYPFPSDSLTIGIRFVDENEVGRANAGIEGIYLYEGKIKYERYEIYEYMLPRPRGRHFDVHTESYAEALALVNQQGCLRLIQ